ncbi:hypothetical protein ACIQZO_00365 [Streptomyces sp. NPDC097617]|uniref:hypothetical protein n=1 Tax=Streptomyces sp. NPDC097617 TaxID=3366091 RepID=UPI0038248BA0
MSAKPTGVAQAAGPDWRKRTLLGAGALAALVVAYFVLAATIARWWSQRVGSAVDGHLATGLLLGLLFGFACTLLPLMLAWIALRRRRSWKATAGWLAVALLLALPNLWTLSVVAGGGGAAHAGQRVMDVQAPWFRGATLAGAIAAVVAFGAFLYLDRRRRTRPARRAA